MFGRKSSTCPVCHGNKEVTVKHTKAKEGQPKEEKVPCPKCGGTGLNNLRTK